MKWEKAAALLVILYLAAALPFYVFQTQALAQCNEACVSRGFDSALETRGLFSGIECQCFEKHSGAEEWVPLAEFEGF